MEILLSFNHEKKHYLFVGDLLILLLGYLLAASLDVAVSRFFNVESAIQSLIWQLYCCLLVLPFVLYVFDLYDQMSCRYDLKIFLHITLAVTIALSVVVSFSYILFPLRFSLKRSVITNTALLVVLTPLIFAWRKLFVRLLSKGISGTPRTVVIGDAPLLHEIAHKGGPAPRAYADVLTVSEQPVYADDAVAAEGLANLVKNGNSSNIVVVNRLDNFPLLRKQLIESRFSGVAIYDEPYFYEAITGRVPINHIKDSWFLFRNQGSVFNPGTYRMFKRFMDAGLALIGIIVTSPLMILLAVAIKLTSKGPVLFTMERLGQHERPFRLLKFRTMVDGAERLTGPARTSKGDPRVTGVGRIIRKARLDELPNLLNILKGDMSFVGPRPIRKHFAEQLADQNPYYRLRFKVKPGATGWAQVKGTYAETNDGELEKLEYDLYYIQNQSLTLDLNIILCTIKTILHRKGQ